MQTFKPMVAGNWKMNGSSEILPEFIADLKTIKNPNVDVAIFPPAIFISAMASGLQNSQVQVGAQNAHTEVSGAYTGEISASMFAELGCHYLLAGHSERRGQGESNQLVANKCRAAQSAQLTPILCVGESEQERQQGQTEATVDQQLSVVLEIIGPNALKSAIIAYEPIWAIGTGTAADTKDIAIMHGFLRSWLESHLGQEAAQMRLLYGGSVSETNAAGIFAQPNVNGVLVGGASLDMAKFSKIIGCVPIISQTTKLQ